MHIDLITIKSVSVTLDHRWPFNTGAHFTTNKRVGVPLYCLITHTILKPAWE